MNYSNPSVIDTRQAWAMVKHSALDVGFRRDTKSRPERYLNTEKLVRCSTKFTNGDRHENILSF